MTIEAKHELPEYQRPRETAYVIDFGKIFQPEAHGQQMGALMANYILAANLRPDMIVKPYLVRKNPVNHQEEYHLAKILSERLEKPSATFYEYEDGEPETLIGPQPHSGQHVVIVDGAVRTGGTILRTAAHLRRLDSSIVVCDAVVYMVRPQGKKLDALVQRLSNEGVRLHSLISSSDLLKRLLVNGYLSEAQYQKAMTDEDFH